MKKPVLIVMAAGIGSRYGGLKQIEPIGPNGELIIDYSLFDAARAGFETVIFIIKEEIEKDFKEAIGNRIPGGLKAKYAYQRLDNIPKGYAVPKDRVKPWGTCHAVLSAKGLMDKTPFAVINADDYYGTEAFKLIYDYLLNNPDSDRLYEYAMVGYQLENTVTEYGHVARGICVVDSEGYLEEVIERTKIEKKEDGIFFTENDGESWVKLHEDSIVSMNIWGFNPSFMDEAEKGFPAFLSEALETAPTKAEYFLPTLVSKLVEQGKARVKVLKTSDKWYGVTYKEDRHVVAEAMAQKHKDGLYPTLKEQNS